MSLRAISPRGNLVIREVDDAGSLTASYVHSRSENQSSKLDQERVDVVLPERRDTKSYAQKALDAFLPSGYPHSVSRDYLRYQIWDSLQAFASSIAGLLSSRAVLEGVGVGNSTATPQNALLLSIIQDSLGRIATILFAHRFGTAIEPECKMYRLLADVFNDIAMILDCLSPAFPQALRVGVLAGSSVLRALTGVCAGSAKGCLSAHFAARGNLGELNAKDSSQETVISLGGMLVGTLVVSLITSKMATWTTLILLLSAHLAMNYAAVCAVCMRSLNRQRCNIVVSNLIAQSRVLTPEQVSQQEVVFELDGVLRWQGGCSMGRCRMGASMEVLMRALARRDKYSGSYRNFTVSMTPLLELYRRHRYLLWYERDGRIAIVVIKEGATARDQLTAWIQALLLARLCETGPPSEDALLSLERTLVEASTLLDDHKDGLEHAGWDLDVAALETRTGTRIAWDL